MRVLDSLQKRNDQEKVPPLPKATLCIMSYSEHPSIYLMRSLMRDIRDWPTLEVFDRTNEAEVDRARSQAATLYLEQGIGDVFVMIDEDTGWDPGSLEHLVASCYEIKAIVGGIYSYRAFGGGVATRLPPGVAATIGQDRLIRVSYVSTGFFAIHRKVLVALAQDLPLTIHGFYPFFMPFLRAHPGALGTEQLSEDWAICARAADAGFAIYADLRPRIVHHGSHGYRPIDSIIDLPPDQDVTIKSVDHSAAQPLKDGHHVYIDPDDRIVSRSVLKAQEWEPEVVEAVKRYAGEDKTLIEIGAHIGVHTVQLAPAFRELHAIEPMPHAFDLLTRNMNANESHNVKAYRCAIGDHEGKARMIRDHANSGASYLNPSGDDLGIEVDITTTKALLDGARPDVLKIDAEGAEPMILASNPDLLECPVIVTEYCDAQFRRVSNLKGEHYLKLLRSAGYQLSNIKGEPLIDHHLPTGFGFCNIIATKGNMGGLTIGKDRGGRGGDRA